MGYVVVFRHGRYAGIVNVGQDFWWPELGLAGAGCKFGIARLTFRDPGCCIYVADIGGSQVPGFDVA